MTAFSKVSKGKISDRSNKKDGGALNRQRDYNAKLESLGFTRTDWNKHGYTWPGEFPAFALTPGTIATDDGPQSGLIARCHKAEIEFLFPYGTAPNSIKARLDDEILAIMGLQADVADPTPSDFIPFLGEPVTVPMIVEGQEIGLEIGF